MQDARTRQREMLQESLTRLAESQPAGSGELVLAQLEASEPADYEPVALACLSAAEAAGGNATAALSGATAIAFLVQMGLVFAGLENVGGAASLSTAWGMPRSLNAGDAMFALSQEAILSAPEELTAEERLSALALLDQACRVLAESLNEAGPDAATPALAQRAALPAAMELGALLARSTPEVRQRLAELGRAWKELPDEELARNLAGDPRYWLAR